MNQPNSHGEPRNPSTSEMSTPLDYSLPVVTNEVAASLAADVAEQGEMEVLALADERLATNNPELRAMMGEYVKTVMGITPEEYDDPEEYDNAILFAQEVMILTHELMRRQAETDELNRSLGE